MKFLFFLKLFIKILEKHTRENLLNIGKEIINCFGTIDDVKSLRVLDSNGRTEERNVKINIYLNML